MFYEIDVRSIYRKVRVLVSLFVNTDVFQLNLSEIYLTFKRQPHKMVKHSNNLLYVADEMFECV